MPPFIEYKENKINLNKNDLLILFTDEYNEAKNSNMEEFGMKNLLSFFLNNKDLPIDDLISTLNNFFT